MDGGINLEEIENLVEKKFQGQATDLDKWFDDASFTQQCVLILSSPNVKFNSAFFAILVLIHHVDRFFCFWDLPSRFNFAQFVFGLKDSFENLFNQNPPLLAQYSRLAGSVIVEGYDSDPRFQTFLMQMVQTQPKSLLNNKIILNILTEVSESMRLLRILAFDGIPIAATINYSLQSMGYSNNDKEIVSVSLKSILSAFNYYVIGFDNKNDDLKQSIIIHDEVRNLLLNSHLIQQLFLIAPIEPALCFEILTIFVSSINFDTRSKLLLSFAEQVMKCMELNLVSDALNQFFRLILSLKARLDTTVQNQYDFMSFVQKVYNLSISVIKTPASIQQDHSTIGYILNFFETVNEEKAVNQQGFIQLIALKMDIIKSFAESAMELLSSEGQIDINAIGLDDSEHFHPWYISINKIIKKNAPEMINILFQTFNRQDTMNQAQVSFMCAMILAILYESETPPQQQEAPYVESFSNSFFRIATVYKNYISSPYIINSFLLFLRHLNNFLFLCDTSHFTHQLYLKFKEKMNIGTCEEMLQFLIHILFTIFQNCDQEKFILDGCKALSYLFKNHSSFYQFIIRVPIVSNIVKIRVENPFPFLLKENHSRSRTVFHSSIATMLVNKNEEKTRDIYLSLYNQALTKPNQNNAPLSGTINESIWGFLCDFTGFFKYVKSVEDFHIFFYYLFTNHHFESLIGHVTSITSFPPLILIQVLKFWNALLDNKIEFRQHSQEGILLFHFALDTLKAVLKAVMPILQPGADLTRKTVYYIFRIINSLLAANYVPYACFDMYNDTGLVELLSLFGLCLGAAPPSELTQYPKLEKVLIQLAETICRKHIEATAKNGVNCTAVILDIINFGLRSSNSYVRQESITCLTNFMSFRGIYVCVPSGDDQNTLVPLDLSKNPNIGLMTIISKDKLINSACGLWNMVLTNNAQDSVINCIMEIFKRLPEMLEFVHSKMQMFLIQDQQSVEHFENEYKNFFQACSKMFGSGDTTLFKPEIKKFINEASKCLRAPTKVFTRI